MKKRLFPALLVLALSAGSLVGAGPAPAAAAGVPNPSFDQGWSGGRLKCWNVAGTGLSTATFTVTRTGHTGRAAYVKGKGAAGSRLKLFTDRTEQCRVPVTAGRAYTMGFWLRSTAGAEPVVFGYSARTGWVPWFTAPKVPKGDMKQYTVALPAIPAGMTGVSVGLGFSGRSVLVLDDVTLVPTGRPTSPVLFRPTFPQTESLVTNEFAYWSPTNAARVVSPDWEMTSGSLFARNGNGYTGRINNVQADARSRAGTNSAIFRLTTRNTTFRNVLVQANLNVATLSSTSTTPRVDWDGVHLFLRYRSEYELYYASVARRDGKVVIKKKCRGGPINGGTYYPISPENRGQAIRYGQWVRVGASVRTNPSGSVTIVLFRDGKPVVTATDSGVGCRPITLPGATGIRGDNALFEFNSFSVTAN